MLVKGGPDRKYGVMLTNSRNTLHLKESGLREC